MSTDVVLFCKVSGKSAVTTRLLISVIVTMDIRLFWVLVPEASFGHRVLSSPASVGLWVCVYQSRACPHDNSSPSQARITKFGPEMQTTLVWVPIVFGDDRP